MKQQLPLPPLEVLEDLFALDPVAPSGLRRRKTMGRSKSGSIAGWIMANGYWQVCVNRKAYLASRVVYKMYNNGADPLGFEVDHLDRNKSNNAGTNLILATPADQQSNRDAFGSISYRNVYKENCKRKEGRIYCSSVRRRIDGVRKNTHIGRFSNPYEASLAALVYKRKNGMRWEFAPGGTK